MEKTLFWLCVGFVVYVYGIYPLFVCVAAQVRPPRGQGRDVAPPVSVLVPAYNEEAIITEKVENTLAFDYPRHQIEIIVASDGSGDRTVELAGRFSASGVHLYPYMQHEGKTCVLNKTLPKALGEIVLLTDAHARLESGALRKLVRHFDDATVGCVGGRKQMAARSGGAPSQGEGLYFGFESFLKKAETRLHSSMGVDGAILAFRKKLFVPLPGYCADDFFLSMKIIEAGYRVVYEPEAVARIGAARSMKGETERKIRTQTQLLLTLPALLPLLNPLRSPVWWQLLSHRVGRLLVPWAMVAALLLSFLLRAEGLVYRLALWGQGALYLLAVFGYVLALAGKRTALTSAPLHFGLANWAVVVAWWRVMRRGREGVRWAKTQRAV